MLPEGISLLNEKCISHVVKILVVTGCASYLEPSFQKSNASKMFLRSQFIFMPM